MNANFIVNEILSNLYITFKITCIADNLRNFVNMVEQDELGRFDTGATMRNHMVTAAW